MTDQYRGRSPQAPTTSTQPSFIEPPLDLEQPAPGHLMSSSTSDYASWGKRVRARLIDQIPAYLGLIIFYVGYLILIVRVAVSDGATTNFAGPAVAMIIGLAVMAVSLPWIAYNRWITAGKTGQSLGKRVTKIRLIGEQTNAPIGAKNAFIRDLVHLLDALTLVGYLWPLWDAKKQTFADQIMKAIVINEARHPSFVDLG